MSELFAKEPMHFVANAEAFPEEDVLEEQNRLLTRNYIPESAKPIAISIIQVSEEKYTTSASVGDNIIYTVNARRAATPNNAVMIQFQPTYFHGSISNDNILPSSTNTLLQGNYSIYTWTSIYAPLVNNFIGADNTMTSSMALTNTSGSTQTIIFQQKFKYLVNDGGVVLNA